MTAMDKITEFIKAVERLILIAAVLLAAFYAHRFDKERSLKEAALLSAKGLPPDVLAQYTYQNNKLIEMVKNAQGKTEAKTVYVPDEGKVTVITKERDEAIKKYQELLEQLKAAKTPTEIKKIDADLQTVSEGLNKAPDITATTKGFTSRFGYGIVVSPGHSLEFTTNSGSHIGLPISPLLDWKYGYWNRYSALVQVNAFYPGVEFTRHLDDVTPRWMHMDNTELGASFGPGWTGGYDGGVNLRTNW